MATACLSDHRVRFQGSMWPVAMDIAGKLSLNLSPKPLTPERNQPQEPEEQAVRKAMLQRLQARASISSG